MIYDLSITVHVFARCMLTSFLVDEILLPRYVNLSSDYIYIYIYIVRQYLPVAGIETQLTQTSTQASNQSATRRY